ncbi:MAG: hypothetical protein V4594_07710 [Bacteroidota bacterium]
MVRNDTGYVNEHGVHFFAINDGEINVHLTLKVDGEDNFAYLALEELSPEELMQRYGMDHLEDLSDFNGERMWEEYHKGRAFMACVAGEPPQADMKFRIRDGKTVVIDTNKETEVVLEVVIDSALAAEEYVLSLGDQVGDYEE